jgi:uncharacterized protein (DUF427 family)
MCRRLGSVAALHYLELLILMKAGNLNTLLHTRCDWTAKAEYYSITDGSRQSAQAFLTFLNHEIYAMTFKSQNDDSIYWVYCKPKGIDIPTNLSHIDVAVLRTATNF